MTPADVQQILRDAQARPSALTWGRVEELLRRYDEHFAYLVEEGRRLRLQLAIYQESAQMSPARAIAVPREPVPCQGCGTLIQPAGKGRLPSWCDGCRRDKARQRQAQRRQAA
jgi:hypothetical protein